MTSDSPKPVRRAAAAVIRAMARELRRQAEEGTLMICRATDDPSRVVVEGCVDLAMLALVTESAMVREFGR